MNTLKTIKCDNCGGSIELDLDNLIYYCPSCGSVLHVDLTIIKDILITREKEQTIRNKDNVQLEQKKDENRTILYMMIMLIGIAVVGIVALIICDI